jgi:hypothetical protein
MIPYYSIDDRAPMPEAFKAVGWEWARWIVAIGAICSLSTSLLGAMFPLPRILYAISSDGLIFRFLSKLNARFQTPLLATILSGIFAGLMAMMFNLDELVNMMSIGTLLAYSLVAISVILLRYQYEPSNGINERGSLITNDSSSSSSDEEQRTQSISNKSSLFNRLFYPSSTNPNTKTARLVGILISICTLDIVVLCAILSIASEMLDKPYVYVFLIIFGLKVILIGVCIWRQPQNKKSITFKMPLVPLLPILSVFINFYLMAVLNKATWIRFAVWMLLG